MSIKEEFVELEEPRRRYRFMLGRHLATPLSGFIAGVILTGIVWALARYLQQIILGQ